MAQRKQPKLMSFMADLITHIGYRENMMKGLTLIEKADKCISGNNRQKLFGQR